MGGCWVSWRSIARPTASICRATTRAGAARADATKPATAATNGLDLPARATWLYDKAWMHMVDGPGRNLLLDVAQTWAGEADSRRFVEACGEDVVIDLTLFEGGVFADFVATRGVVLPADERLLAEQWLLVERSVHEVESVRRDRGFTSRDIRTGERARGERAARHAAAEAR